MLIDDDKPTTFINEIVIRNADCARKCISMQSGEEALNFLITKEVRECATPDLIFLDINMPGMDGWEFINACMLKYEQIDDLIVVMLTTSINPDDKEKANGIDVIDDFQTKPLTVSMVHELVTRHFTGKTDN